MCFPACSSTAQSLMKNDYNTFLDLIKHSQSGNIFTSQEERAKFEENYVNTTPILNGAKKRVPKYMQSQIGILPFCETATSLTLTSVSRNYPSKCELFDLTITPKGI